MKRKALFVCLAGGALINSAADAAYLGLTVRLHTQAQVGQGAGPPSLRSVFRVYAVFSDPGDFLTSVAGSPVLGNLFIRSLSPTGLPPGGEFVNPLGGGATAPYYAYIGTQVEWDTYVTIGGVAGQLDLTGLSPGFNGLPNSGSYMSNNAGWFTAGPIAQGMAGNGLNLGGGNWGVLMMQLTVNAGNHVAGTVAVGGVNNNPIAGGTTFQTFADQTFDSGFVPSPGILPALAIAGAFRSRRRRT